MDFLPFWKVHQARQITSRICRCQWRNFLLSSGNLSGVLCVHQPLCQPTKLKLLWRCLLSVGSRVIWRHFWGIGRLQSSSKNERNILYLKKPKEKPLLWWQIETTVLLNFSCEFYWLTHFFFWHFLWVFLVNTHTTLEPKRTEARPIAWNTWAHEQCPIGALLTENKCQLLNYFQKLADSKPVTALSTLKIKKTFS